MGFVREPDILAEGPVETLIVEILAWSECGKLFGRTMMRGFYVWVEAKLPQDTVSVVFSGYQIVHTPKGPCLCLCPGKDATVTHGMLKSTDFTQYAECCAGIGGLGEGLKAQVQR